MPTELDLDGLQRLLKDRDVQLIEVLPQNEYDEEHLPGSISIPLKSMSADGAADLDESRPAVVYCWDDS